MGYISDDNFSDDGTAHEDKIKAGKYACVFIGGTPQRSGTLQVWRSSHPEAEYIAIDRPQSTVGREPTLAQAGLSGWMINYITKDCKGPIKAIQIFTYLISEEGGILCKYGVEGKTYEINSDGYFKKSTKEFVEHPGAEMTLIKIYPNEVRQEILGFGGALTEASACVWSKMSRANQERLINLYFGPESNRYNLCRLHIQSCDFSLGNRSYIADGDDELKTFSIEGGRAYTLPLVHAALERDGEMNHGGKLKEEYYDAWARLIVKYVQAYEQEGIVVSRLTLQNEPAATQTWDSCIFSAEDERRFACGYLRKRLDEAGYTSVKLNIWITIRI